MHAGRRRYEPCTSPVATGGLAPGSHSFAVRARDPAGAASAATSHTWVVDLTAPTATDVQLTSKAGGAAGRLENGDVLTLGFSEAIDPASAATGLNATTSTAVTLRFTKGAGATPDSFAAYDGAGNQIAALGTISLGQAGYVTSSALTFIASMITNAAGTQIVITLGAPSNSKQVATVTTAGTMRWSPGAVCDLAGNGLGNAGTAVVESGPADAEG